MGKGHASIWSPLSNAAFRRLYLVYLLSFASNAMIEASAAWELTRSGAPPSFVALISTAATLPIVFFIVPFGALADTFDRRKLIYISQLWSLGAAVLLSTAAWGLFAPRWEFLALVALNGVAMAIRLPSMTSMVGNRVDGNEVANTMALLGLGTSLTRIGGPFLAGFLISLSGAGLAFACAATLSLLAFAVSLTLKSKNRAESLPAERFLGAMRGANSFTRQSPQFRQLLYKGFFFFFIGSGAFALAPMALSIRFGGSNTVFMSSLAASGTGALIVGQILPILRSKLKVQQIARLGALTMALASVCLALVPTIWLGLLGAFLNGAGWLIGHSTFTSRAQQLLPDWVRARGMSVTHAVMISAVASGAFFWGSVTDRFDFITTFWFCASLAFAMVLFPGWMRFASLPETELSPKSYWNEPALAVLPKKGDGPAVLQVRYKVDPSKVAEFLRAANEGRRLRLRSGALSWLLMRDLEDPDVFIEQVMFESWEDRQRHAARTTEADAIVRMRKMSSLVGPDAYEPQHLLAVSVNANGSHMDVKSPSILKSGE